MYIAPFHMLVYVPYCLCLYQHVAAIITVVIGKIIHGVVVLERSYYSGSGLQNGDGFFYIWGCCN